MKKIFYEAKAVTGEIIKGYCPCNIEGKDFMCIFAPDNSATFVEINPETIKKL